MKKLVFFASAFISAISAFAYDSYGFSSYNEGLSGFEVFTICIMIFSIILSVIVLFRWWKMTVNVERICKKITRDKSTLTYLVATGEKEQAEKTAITMLADLLFPIYEDVNVYNKAEVMNKVIFDQLPMIEKLGLSVPDYYATGEKFIDYINGLTGGKVPYKDANKQSYVDSFQG